MFRPFIHCLAKGKFRPSPPSSFQLPFTYARTKKDAADMTAEEELRMLLQWAERMHFENVAAAVRRVLAKLPVSQRGRPETIEDMQEYASFCRNRARACFHLRRKYLSTPPTDYIS